MAHAQAADSTRCETLLGLRRDVNRIQEPLSLHERVPICDSFAKYAVAFFRISRSMRASASSFLKRAFSVMSSATDCSPGLAFRRAALAATTRFPKVPFAIDSRFPVSSWVCPCSITTFTASAFNSALYFRGSLIFPFRSVTSRYRVYQTQYKLFTFSCTLVRSEFAGHDAKSITAITNAPQRTIGLATLILPPPY